MASSCSRCARAIAESSPFLCALASCSKSSQTCRNFNDMACLKGDNLRTKRVGFLKHMCSGTASVGAHPSQFRPAPGSSVQNARPSRKHRPIGSPHKLLCRLQSHHLVTISSRYFLCLLRSASSDTRRLPVRVSASRTWTPPSPSDAYQNKGQVTPNGATLFETILCVPWAMKAL
jgi:hypothetical protein